MTSTTAVLGLEVGVSGARAAVATVGGEVVSTATSAAPPLHLRGTGDDPEGWLDGIWRAGGEAVRAAARPIAAIGVACLGPAPILVDASGLALTAGRLAALDHRSAAWRTALGTGPDHVLPRLMAMIEDDPGLVSRTDCVLDPTGFVVLALTGERVMDRLTAHYYTWPGHDLPVVAPPVGEPTDLTGHLTDEAASRLGLPSEVPVTAGTIDSYADLGRAGVGQAGDGGVILGSTLVIGVVSDRPGPYPPLETAPHLGAGYWVGGATATAGLALDWIDQIIGGDEDLRIAARELEPGDPISLPYLAGERTPLNDPQARGVIAGLTLATRRERLYRSMVDGVAVTALHHLRLLEGNGIAPDRFRVTGGGVHNLLWLEATCDALGVPLEVVAGGAPGMGAAWLAMEALGMNVETRVETTLRPDASRHNAYRLLLERSRRLWEHAGDVVRSPDEPGSGGPVE